MGQADYRGARGSNAGDDFHELWALRQALATLNEDSGLVAVTVEGLRAEDEVGTLGETWDGVDCALYYGDDRVATAHRIVVDQLKYSAANPDQAWTIARLTHTSNKRRDNSVVGRLAKVFARLKEQRPDLVAQGNLQMRLVSNQPVDPAVLVAFSNGITPPQDLTQSSVSHADRIAVRTAAGLQSDDFDAFSRSLDFSNCGRGSRFALEERILLTIASCTDADARTMVDDLMRFVRRAMMPEAKDEVITRHSILAQLGFSDPHALFPCPSTIKQIAQFIPRDVARHINQWC